jgi:hypothetical protein
VVFVHGLGGDRMGSWLEPKSKTFWPRDLLVKDLPDARIMTYGYNFAIDQLLHARSHNLFNEQARDLLECLAQIREVSETVCQKLDSMQDIQQ